MSYADQVFIKTCQDILSRGVWDTDREVRPRWEDGSPAHTIKLFGVVNRYDLREEFPMLTVRKQYLKSAVDELLWIWQKKSNNIHDLHSHVWDAWADENGSIGKAYGYQLGVKHHYPQGDMDQVDKILWDLKHDPASRRWRPESGPPVRFQSSPSAAGPAPQPLQRRQSSSGRRQQGPQGPASFLASWSAPLFPFCAVCPAWSPPAPE